jgi:DNA polymerase V
MNFDGVTVANFHDYFIDDAFMVINRNLEPTDNKITVCYIDNEFTVKRIKTEKNCIYLMLEDKDFQPIKVDEDNELIL